MLLLVISKFHMLARRPNTFQILTESWKTPLWFNFFTIMFVMEQLSAHWFSSFHIPLCSRRVLNLWRTDWNDVLQKQSDRLLAQFSWFLSRLPHGLTTTFLHTWLALFDFVFSLWKDSEIEGTCAVSFGHSNLQYSCWMFKNYNFSFVFFRICHIWSGQLNREW